MLDDYFFAGVLGAVEVGPGGSGRGVDYLVAVLAFGAGIGARCALSAELHLAADFGPSLSDGFSFSFSFGFTCAGSGSGRAAGPILQGKTAFAGLAVSVVGEALGAAVYPADGSCCFFFSLFCSFDSRDGQQ